MNMTNTSTKATTPCIIWVHEVIALAGCQVEEMEHFCGRERLLRWYQAGEAVWMAADSLKQFVRQGKLGERNDREVNAMHDMLKVPGPSRHKGRRKHPWEPQ